VTSVSNIGMDPPVRARSAGETLPVEAELQKESPLLRSLREYLIKQYQFKPKYADDMLGIIDSGYNNG
jgi:hypothetical protein